MPRHLRLLVLIAALAGAVPAFGTILAPVSLTDLVAGSATIAYGRVATTQAADGPRGVETTVTLTGVAVLKGDPDHAVVFRVPGGRVGRYTTVVVGAPALQPGDEVVVFLSAGPEARLVGFSQGLLRVVRPSADAVPMVLAPPSAAGQPPGRIVRGAARRYATLAAFIDDVRGLVTQAARRERDRRAAAGGGAAGW